MKAKSALVLAGGGLTGAVYEIGALRAIDDLLVDRTVNDFDIYVGTSAGALVASMLALGISPATMFEVINGTHAGVRPIQRRDLFNFNRSDILQVTRRLPGKLLATGVRFLRNPADATFLDVAWSLTDVLPSGLYDSMALERYLRQSLDGLGYSNRFCDLEKRLHIIATNLDSGERAIFGPGMNEDVPISLAVAASSALPLFYKPVSIGNQQYVDGGLRGTASLDLAIEEGAKLVVCINPLVPFHNRDEEGNPVWDESQDSLSAKGVRAVTDQMLAILLHSGLHYHIKQLRRRHRDVDIILIEPRCDDELMHFTNIMSYSTRLAIARHGFESVTLDLAQDFAEYRQVLARQGIPVTRRLLVEEMQEIAAAGNDPAVLARILYARPPAREQQDSPVGRLTRALADLDLFLYRLEEREPGG